MFWLSWLRTRTRPGVSEARRTPKPARPRAALRPRLEALEDRLLPSTLTVTNTLDSGKGSLRYEIAQAQSNDTIVFNFGTIKNPKKAPPPTITLTSGELDITKNLTIQGPGAGQLTISGNRGTFYASRVFEVAANTTVALSGLTISDGSTSFDDGFGGGILNHGTLTVSGCTISNNDAPFVVYQVPGSGGGIYSDGTLTVSDCTVSNNSAYSSGGGIYNAAGATLAVTGGTVSGNGGLYGGGIYNAGKATVSNTTVSGNVANQNGDVATNVHDIAWGGGIYNAGTLTVTGGTISGNVADLGGGIYNELTVAVPAGSATVSGCTISDNNAFQGGGIYNNGTMTVSGSYVQNNSAQAYFDPSAHGGGIYNAGTLTVLDSIFSGNITNFGIPDNIFGPYTDGGGNTFL
jgi:hypothetical protein